MRLLAETLRLATRLPQSLADLAVTLPARLMFFFYYITVTSAVAQFGLALPMVVYFHRVGFSGLSANALVVPIMGFALPVGFAAVLTGWGWIATIAAGLLTVSRAVVNWQAAIEQNWRIPTPPLWLGAALSAATIAELSPRASLAGCPTWRPSRPPPSSWPGRIMGDPVRLQQVLLHLLSNAVKSTDTGKAQLEISVGCSSDPAAGLLFRILDTGIGMTPQVLNRLFTRLCKRLCQFPPLRRYGPGSGHRQASGAAHDGSMGVESQAGQGTTFWFLIPLEAAAAPPAPAPFGPGQNRYLRPGPHFDPRR